MEINQIIDRHEKFPGATKDLIEAYGFQQYRKAVNDLLNHCGNFLEVPHSKTAIIVCDISLFNDWKNAKLSDYKMNKK